MRFGKKCVSGKTSLGRNANLTKFEVFSGFAFRPPVSAETHFFQRLVLEIDRDGLISLATKTPQINQKPRVWLVRGGV
jgi:hypothetical protein